MDSKILVIEVPSIKENSGQNRKSLSDGIIFQLVQAEL